jgi:hypothetical protein
MPMFKVSNPLNGLLVVSNWNIACFVYFLYNENELLRFQALAVKERFLKKIGCENRFFLNKINVLICRHRGPEFFSRRNRWPVFHFDTLFKVETLGAKVDEL